MRRWPGLHTIRRLLILLVCATPSWTVHFNSIEVASAIPGKWYGGDPFFLLREHAEFEYFTEGRRLTFLSSKNLLFGVIPLEARRPVSFYGWRLHRGDSVFSGARMDWFVRFFLIQKNPQDPIDLRFPASVWQKVSGNDDERAKDRAKMARLYDRFDGDLNFECLKAPMLSKTVSLYGSPRQLPDGHYYHHTGEDLRAVTGTPIYAIGPGEVEFAGEMIVPGKTVMLYHGGGLHSRYLHMSRLETEEGFNVKRGQRLGLSGGTGRVTAPHLHWEVVWKGLPANPNKFLKVWRTICAN